MSQADATFTFSFRKQFAPAVMRGEKRQTIRPNRKDGRKPKPGDRVKLFVGMRTAYCKALGNAIVTDCFPVYMDLASREPTIAARGVRLNFREMQAFAESDGFRSMFEMIGWFRETYKGDTAFHGFCVRWGELRRGPRKVVK